MGLLHRRAHGLPIAHVRDMDLGAAAGRAAGFGRGVEALLVATKKIEARAVLRIGDGERPADAGRGAGDEEALGHMFPARHRAVGLHDPFVLAAARGGSGPQSAKRIDSRAPSPRIAGRGLG